MPSALYPRAKFTRAATLAITTIAFSAMGIVFAAPAHAAPISVCSSGCDHTTVQDAVNAATAGDTITLAAGTYNESVTINKSLTVLGPNAGTSPNTADPLVANGARNAEAIIQLRAADGVNALRFTNAAESVTISGVTIELASTTTDQRYFYGSAKAGGSLTLTNNIFTGGLGAVEGAAVYKSALGDISVTLTGNRFTDGGESNGLNIYNANATATVTLAITQNVWLDNDYLAGNFSTVNGAKFVGTISDNWFGNSTPGTGGVDNWNTRQAGFLLAGTYDGLQISHNTFKNIEDIAIWFYSNFSGSVNITDNIIDGYSNVLTSTPTRRAAVLARTGGNVSQIVFSGNSIEGPTAGSLAVFNPTDTGIFDARGNWWGSDTPDFDALMSIPSVGHPEFTILVEEWLSTWGQPSPGTPPDHDAGPAGTDTNTPVATGANTLAATGIDAKVASITTILAVLFFAAGAALMATKRRLQRE